MPGGIYYSFKPTQSLFFQITVQLIGSTVPPVRRRGLKHVVGKAGGTIIKSPAHDGFCLNKSGGKVYKTDMRRYPEEFKASVIARMLPQSIRLYFKENGKNKIPAIDRCP